MGPTTSDQCGLNPDISIITCIHNIHISSSISSSLQESGVLSHSEIQDIINIANEVAEHTRLLEAAVAQVNEVLVEGDADKTLEALQSGALDLREVYPENKIYYHEALLARKQKKARDEGGALTEEDIQAVVREMNEKAAHDRQGDDPLPCVCFKTLSKLDYRVLQRHSVWVCGGFS